MNQSNYCITVLGFSQTCAELHGKLSIVFGNRPNIFRFTKLLARN